MTDILGQVDRTAFTLSPTTASSPSSAFLSSPTLKTKKHQLDEVNFHIMSSPPTYDNLDAFNNTEATKMALSGSPSESMRSIKTSTTTRSIIMETSSVTPVPASTAKLLSGQHDIDFKLDPQPSISTNGPTRTHSQKYGFNSLTQRLERFKVKKTQRKKRRETIYTRRTATFIGKVKRDEHNAIGSVDSEN